MQSHVKVMIDQWRTVSPVWIILALAVTPAVCEELFFRGYLLTALRTRFSAATAILVSAVMFGAFHLILSGGVSVIRFVPSTLMGLVLGWSCVRSQSVFPGILLHAIHNGLLLSVAYYGAELRARGWDVEDATHLPPLWLGIATMTSVAGVFLMSRLPRTSQRPSTESKAA